MFGIQTEDKATAIAAALSYWVFRCRDRAQTPAMGVKTWEYLQSSIANAAIPSRTVDDYLENLCKKLVISSLRPQQLAWIIQPNVAVLQAVRNEDGSLGEIKEFKNDQEHPFIGWQHLLNDLKREGITERHIVGLCREKPHIVATYVRVRYEEDKQIGKAEEEAIDV